MPSATEPIAPGQSESGFRFGAWFARWNRKLHFYSGLFLLFFSWLFAFSGLLLHHSKWNSAQFWKSRKETNYEREIAVPAPEVKGDLAQAREIMAALGIEGEILWTTTRTSPDLFEFQVRRPGHFFFIKADLERKRASVR